MSRIVPYLPGKILVKSPLSIVLRFQVVLNCIAYNFLAYIKRVLFKCQPKIQIFLLKIQSFLMRIQKRWGSSVFGTHLFYLFVRVPALHFVECNRYSPLPRSCQRHPPPWFHRPASGNPPDNDNPWSEKTRFPASSMPLHQKSGRKNSNDPVSHHNNTCMCHAFLPSFRCNFQGWLPY